MVLYANVVVISSTFKKPLTDLTEYGKYGKLLASDGISDKILFPLCYISLPNDTYEKPVYKWDNIYFIPTYRIDKR